MAIPGVQLTLPVPLQRVQRQPVKPPITTLFRDETVGKQLVMTLKNVLHFLLAED